VRRPAEHARRSTSAQATIDVGHLCCRPQDDLEIDDRHSFHHVDRLPDERSVAVAAVTDGAVPAAV